MELHKAIILVVAIVEVTSAGKHDIYSRHSVHGVQLRDRSDLKVLHTLELDLDLDLWQHGSPARRDALIMVSPEKSNQFLETLDKNGMTHYLYLADVAKALKEHDEQLIKSRAARQDTKIFQDYLRYDEINAYLDTIAREYPNIATVVTVGRSFEGREIKYLKISTTNFTDASKPIYFMEAMLHAREWVTTPVTLYSIHRLVEDLRTEDRDLLEEIDWIIMPMTNPDGYEFSHTDERLWRKTRSVLNGTTCLGVDANRNFDYAFNTIGVSSNPCAITYPGPMAFSEPETSYVRDVLLEYLDRIEMFMDIHSFGNYVLFGYGNDILPPNVAPLHFVGAAMGAVMDAMKLPQVGYYLVGNSGMVLYGASGCADDYALSIGVPFSYTLELPGYQYDFRVPAEYLDQINEESWAGIAETARLTRLYYRTRYNAGTTQN